MGRMDSFESILSLALQEDLAEHGDVTSRAIFSEDWGTAILVSKAEGVLAGSEFFTRTFTTLNKQVQVDFSLEDGDYLRENIEVAQLKGPVCTLLEAERTAINFLAFLSGIATLARRYTNIVQGRTLILDTRKTIPGYRELSKYAVKVGGGTNHRMGLYDMVMIKDNHIDASGSISKAVSKIREFWGDRYRIEVEVRDINEVKEALEAGVDVIMLDNMDVATCEEALALGMGKVFFEASGNMDIDKVARFSETGVDYISVGAITHSSIPLDYSMKILRE